MIFVTVGTHEQQFNRLIKEVDRLKKENLIKDDVFIQIGYSDYTPKHCEYKKFLNYDEMDQYMNQADIIICHGGPSTFMQPLKNGKKTIIVPRLEKFNEHINDHQLDFLKQIKNIFQITYTEDISKLYNLINSYIDTSKFFSNNSDFNKKLRRIIL